MTTRLGEQIDQEYLLKLRNKWVELSVGRYYTEPTWDIMRLRADMLYIPEEPIMTYGKQPALPADVATWHFTSTTKLVDVGAAARMVTYYVDDRDLSGIHSAPFRHAAEWILKGVAGVATPNFSIYGDYRIAERLGRRDRAFAIGRFFQEVGIKVIPDIEWANEIDLEWCSAGLPDFVPALMLQAQRGARSKHAIAEWFKIGVDHLLAKHSIGTIYLYCSSRIFEFLTEPYKDAVRWVHVPTYREIRRGIHG